ncbi:MAG: hypothetical protein ACRD63_03860 [Pyrinomonadaceae bacterium]
MNEEITQRFPRDDLKLIIARLDSIATHLTSLDTRLTTLEGRFTILEERFTAFDARLTTLEERFTALENKVDRRLQETRPIWEQVLVKLDNLDTEVHKGFRKLERQVGLLAEDVLIVRADQRDLERRFSKFESQPAQ